MKRIFVLEAVILSAVQLTASAAIYTVGYYDEAGKLTATKSIERSDDVNIYEYADHYAPEDTAVSRIHKYSNGVWTSSSYGIEKHRENVSYTLKAANVTDEMCNPQYWLKDGSDDLILSGSEIEGLNKRILDNADTMMYDLEALAESYNGVEMKEAQAGFVSPEEMFIDGKPVDEGFYEGIRRNIKDVSVTENENVRYGICTTRTLLKVYPYDEWLSDSEWDKEWDNFVNTAVLVGEPLVLYNSTADGKYIYARSVCCDGWIPASDVAVCSDKDEWIQAKTHKSFLVVTGERVWLEASYDADISQKQLNMGTVLELAESVLFEETNRLAWNNYAVKLPVRADDGSYTEKTALISANRDVNIGYLPYTFANVTKQAFKLLGNRYGWGGMLDSQDCSSFAREIYLCFGLILPRNTSWQTAMPVDVTELGDMTDAEKTAVLDTAPPGSILIFPGHEMIYLGSENGLYYTINDVSSLVDTRDPDAGVVRPRSIIVNDLSTQRWNGTTWLSNLSHLIIVR